MTGFTPVAVSNHPIARSKSEAPNIKWSTASFTEINFSLFIKNPPGTERFDRSDTLIAPPIAPTDRSRSRREIWLLTRFTRKSFIFHLRRKAHCDFVFCHDLFLPADKASTAFFEPCGRETFPLRIQKPYI